MACDVLVGIAQTEGRERSSIYSATAGVLAAYRSDAARASAAEPNFDAARFVDSQDTVYVCAPAHKQALCAPLVVGLLEEIRHATYARHAAGRADRRRPVFFCLDEVANIAPIHDLPALVSEAGGQGLHVLVCLQDLSQVRSRWGDHARRGLPVAVSDQARPARDRRQPHARGDQSRPWANTTATWSPTTIAASVKAGWFGGPGSESSSASYQTVRQRTLSPGEVSQIPRGRGLLLSAHGWGLLRLAPWYATAPWRDIAFADDPRPPAVDAWAPATSPRADSRPSIDSPTRRNTR